MASFLTLFAVLIIVSDVNLAPVNQPDFFAGLEPFLETKVKTPVVSHGPGEVKKVGHLSENEVSKDDLLAQIKENMNELFKNYISSDAIKTEIKDESSLKKEQVLEKKDAIEQLSANTESSSNNLNDQTKTLLKSMFDIFQSKSNNISDILGNRLVETAHGNNLPLKSNSSMEPSKSIDTAGSSESTSIDRSGIAETENQIGITTKSKVTFKDLQEAISKLVIALNRKPVPDLDSLNLKGTRLHEKEKEDSLDIEETSKNNLEKVVQAKTPTYTDLSKALDKVLQHLPSHQEQTSDKMNDMDLLKDSESRMGVSKHKEEAGMTFDEFKDIFYRTFFPGRKQNDQKQHQKIILIGRKDNSNIENAQNDAYADDSKKRTMSDLYEEIRKATEIETIRAREAKREAKKKELVSLLNEILKPEDRLIYDGSRVSLQRKNHVKSLKVDDDEEISETFNKEFNRKLYSTTNNKDEDNKFLKEIESNSVEREETIESDRAQKKNALMKYLKEFIEVLKKNALNENNRSATTHEGEAEDKNQQSSSYKELADALRGFQISSNERNGNRP